MDDKHTAVADNSAQLLELAKSDLASGNKAEAVLYAIRAIEEAFRYAHLEWGYGDAALGGGGQAHKARGRAAASVISNMEASAAGSVTLGDAYPMYIVGDNPIDGLERRVSKALAQINTVELKNALREHRERIDAGTSPARMHQLAHTRNRAQYGEQKGDIWQKPEDLFTLEQARHWVSDAGWILTQFEIAK